MYSSIPVYTACQEVFCLALPQYLGALAEYSCDYQFRCGCRGPWRNLFDGDESTPPLTSPAAASKRSAAYKPAARWVGARVFTALSQSRRSGTIDSRHFVSSGCCAFSGEALARKSAAKSFPMRSERVASTPATESAR